MLLVIRTAPPMQAGRDLKLCLAVSYYDWTKPCGICPWFLAYSSSCQKCVLQVSVPRTCRTCICKSKHRKDYEHPPEAGGDRKYSFLEPSERMQSCWHLNFGPKNSEQKSSVVWSHQVCKKFLTVALRNQYKYKPIQHANRKKIKNKKPTTTKYLRTVGSFKRCIIWIIGIPEREEKTKQRNNWNNNSLEIPKFMANMKRLCKCLSLSKRS